MSRPGRLCYGSTWSIIRLFFLAATWRERATVVSSAHREEGGANWIPRNPIGASLCPPARCNLLDVHNEQFGKQPAASVSPSQIPASLLVRQSRHEGNCRPSLKNWQLCARSLAPARARRPPSSPPPPAHPAPLRRLSNLRFPGAETLARSSEIHGYIAGG